MLHSRKKEHTGREFLIKLTKKSKDELKKIFPELQSVNIRNLLDLDERNSLEIYITVVHGFTGARKCCIQSYRKGCIKELYFNLKGTNMIEERVEIETSSLDESIDEE